METKTTPIVTIIGRPNVGKSTLFNALAGQRKAIVSDIPGTTRDSLMEKITPVESIPFWLVDTAGLTNEKGESIETKIQTQVEVSLQKADLILFIVDGKKELTADDHHVIEKLRKSEVPLIFAANKIDDGNDSITYEFAKTGLGLPIAISAKNYSSIWDLHEQIEIKLENAGFKKDTTIDHEENIIKVALIGRPNVGKSSLFNDLIGTERAVVSDIPGTTRDTIDTQFKDLNGQEYCFLDTAGLRKPGKLGRGLEFWASVRTTKAIEQCDISVLLIDALEGITHQDLTVAGKALKMGKGIIIGVNKFDLALEQAKQKEEADTREVPEVKMWGEKVDDIKSKYLHYLHRKISFLPWAPILFFSAKTGKGTPEILTSIKCIFEERNKRIPTAQLNKWIPEVYYGHVLPTQGTKKGKIKYLSQVDSNPPKFLFSVNNQKAFHYTYLRYLENKIREKYGFFGTPIQIEMKDSMEQFIDRKK